MVQSFLSRQRVVYSVTLLLALWAQQGCSEISKQKEQAAITKCSQLKSLDNIVFRFVNYEILDLDTIILLEMSGSQYSDTVVHVLQAHPMETQPNAFEAVLEKRIPLTNKYIVSLNGEQPHVISNFKMGVKPLSNMFDADYICVLIEYEMDGVVIQNERPIVFGRNKRL